ncbi:MAPEG family protein [Aureimonas frigidaquae]|uniref:Putative membrane protein n=1 Tax=Aureimonas frigidaquae TaxID=424757 RepID=A0A0P0Z0Y5_9HYPH|nr:MAPEG family protein [Aureimonas frigidaquae]BAT27475.1 putative membrane protein [Aureimonas frigidaquae]
MSDAPLPTELFVLAMSVILLFVHIGLQGRLATRERGLDWNTGPRDGEAKPLGIKAGRADRALRNFLETWPAFIALALALAVTGRTGGIAAFGAWLWFLCRIAYLPLYLYGVPYLRSGAFALSCVGLFLMLIRFL